MGYKVELTLHAQEQIENCIHYVSVTLMNTKAAADILDDISHTLDELEELAPSFAFCSDPYLRSRKYQKKPLAKHHYLFIYRVSGDVVYILGFFHMLENYRAKL